MAADGETQQVYEFSLALRDYINTLPDDTKLENIATLIQLKSAIFALADITHELIPLEKGEADETQRRNLSGAITKSRRTDTMIVKYIIKNHCGGEDGHPSATLNDRMAVVYLTDRIVAVKKEIEAVVLEYKRANDRL